MLKWALTGADAVKVSSTGNAVHNLSAVYETGKTTIEGKVDRINNIYDLEGNGYEWTAEANDADYRNTRGGSYFNSGAPRGRSGGNPTYTTGSFCSRPLLYVK